MGGLVHMGRSVLGNSYAFGLSCSCDRHTLPAVSPTQPNIPSLKLLPVSDSPVDRKGRYDRGNRDLENMYTCMVVADLHPTTGAAPLRPAGRAEHEFQPCL